MYESVPLRGFIYYSSLSLYEGNGYIEGKELDGFLKEFVSSVNQSDCGPEVSYFSFSEYIHIIIMSVSILRLFPIRCW